MCSHSIFKTVVQAYENQIAFCQKTCKRKIVKLHYVKKSINLLITNFSSSQILIVGTALVVIGVLLIAIGVGIWLLIRQKAKRSAIQQGALTLKSSMDRNNQQ